MTNLLGIGLVLIAIGIVVAMIHAVYALSGRDG